MQDTPEGVVELLDGLYLIAGYPDHCHAIPGYAGASLYLLRGPDGGFVMVDSGFSRFTPQVDALLGQLGAGGDALRMVAYTHGHRDHAESCAHYSRRGATTAIHEVARTLSGPHGGPVPADRFFRDGDVLEAAGLRLEVYHTPGHTPDSCCFRTVCAGRTVLFAGDLTGWFFPAGGSDYAQMVASVERVRGLGAELICGGHWVCAHDLDAYWEKLAGTLAEGIFSLVDRCGAKEHYRLTAEKFLAR